MSNNGLSDLMSERGQKIIILWTLAFLVAFVIAWVFFLKMLPPPSPALSAEEMKAFFQENGFSIRIGAMIASWVSAPMVPFAVVIAIQLSRLETGRPVWSVLALSGGILMSMFLVFPPILWGVAAFTPDRPAEITMAIMEIATLTMATTDQFYIFWQIAITYVILKYPADELSPFPRWYAWYNLWIALAFEVGAIAFMTKTGPFAWDGVLVFWMPFILFFTWIPVTCWLLWQGISRQEAAKLAAQN